MSLVLYILDIAKAGKTLNLPKNSVMKHLPLLRNFASILPIIIAGFRFIEEVIQFLNDKNK
jgi:hypothetical protein